MPKKLLRLNLSISPPNGEAIDTPDLFAAFKAIEPLIKMGATAGNTPFTSTVDTESGKLMVVWSLT